MRLAINKRGHGGYCVMQGSWFSKVLLFETLWAVPGMMRQGRGWALRGTGPPLAGNVGRGWAFALARDGENRVFTFLRSLWPGPAAAGWFSGGWEWGLGCGGSGRLLCFRGMMRRGRGWVLRGPSRGRWVRCRSDVARDGCWGGSTGEGGGRKVAARCSRSKSSSIRPAPLSCPSSPRTYNCWCSDSFGVFLRN